MFFPSKNKSKNGTWLTAPPPKENKKHTINQIFFQLAHVCSQIVLQIVWDGLKRCIFAETAIKIMVSANRKQTVESISGPRLGQFKTDFWAF